MTPKALKNTSFALVALATLLIVLRIMNFKTPGVSEDGLWFPAPTLIRRILFISYFLLLLLSYLCFRSSGKVNTRFDLTIPVLFLLNGLLLLFLLVVFVALQFNHS
jgi:protein-S-isoprenylcysteine O-methyltransferase Ste14